MYISCIYSYYLPGFKVGIRTPCCSSGGGKEKLFFYQILSTDVFAVFVRFVSFSLITPPHPRPAAHVHRHRSCSGLTLSACCECISLAWSTDGMRSPPGNVSCGSGEGSLRAARRLCGRRRQAGSGAVCWTLRRSRRSSLPPMRWELEAWTLGAWELGSLKL